MLAWLAPCQDGALNPGFPQFAALNRSAGALRGNRGTMSGRLLRQLGLASRQPLSAWGLQSQRCMAAQPAVQEDMIEVTVDGNPVKVAKGSNVLQACDAAGVDVPRCGSLAGQQHTPRWREWCSIGGCAARWEERQGGRSPPPAAGAAAVLTGGLPLPLAGSATTSGCPSPATAGCAWWRCVLGRSSSAVC